MVPEVPPGFRRIPSSGSSFSARQLPPPPPTPPQPPSLDLRLVLCPKIEPLPEPIDNQLPQPVAVLPPQPPSVDLSLVLCPKIEPKPEPVDYHLPQPVALLPQPSPSTGGVGLLLADYLRTAHLYDSSAVADGHERAVISFSDRATQPLQAASYSSDPIPSKKRKPRSGEMVRATVAALRDYPGFRDDVRRARITYESLRQLLVRECSKKKDDDLAPYSGRLTRPDLRAAAIMSDRDLWLNRDQRIVGAVPGISVGDVFLSRIELCVVGLHGQIQAGIDYVPGSRTPTGEPIATSIIVSGGYEDDDDQGLMLIYTGHGGREPNMTRHSIDQKLKGGNLALERSMRYGIEVRVIRGIKYEGSPVGKVYFYDGLYKIVEYWWDTGKSGFGVYKYKLLRIEDQGEMGSSMLKLAEALKVKPLSVRPFGYLSFDMSMGRERLPVRLFNDIDDYQEPLLFEYLASPLYPFEALQPKLNVEGVGCQCVSICSVDCYCAAKNCGEFAYNNSGVLLRGRPLIYECGASCQCALTCPNRASQKGLTHQLEVFRSKETGWGVRSLDLIRAGTFICEFSGIVLTKQQAEIVSMSGSGGLVHPSQFPARWQEWGDISKVRPESLPPGSPFLPALNFSLDVRRARNVACYLSHSDTPNVFTQFVLHDHNNMFYPHVMVFALENIPPLRELSIDYGLGYEWLKHQEHPQCLLLLQ